MDVDDVVHVRLIEAVKKSDNAAVRALLQKKADVNATELLMQFRRVPVEQWTERLAVEAPPSNAARVIMSLVASGNGRYLEEGVDVVPSPLACDREVAGRLWRRCSDMTGLPADGT